MSTLRTPPPRLLRAFELFIWGLIYLVCALVLVLMAIFALLVVAVVVGWLASLIS